MRRKKASRPSRARELKHFNKLYLLRDHMSRPSRARELKLFLLHGLRVVVGRAPRGRVN